MAKLIKGHVFLQFLVTVLDVMLLTWPAYGDGGSTEACDQWADIARKLSWPGNLQNCTVRANDCNRMDCSGSKTFPRQLLPEILKSDIQLSYCFGTQINPCNDPLSVDFYLQVPTKNVSVKYRVVRDEAIELKDLNVPLSYYGIAYPLFNFEFERLNLTAVSFSVIGRINLESGGRHFMVPDLKLPLIDRQVIRVNPCEKTEKNPSQEPSAAFSPEKCQIGQSVPPVTIPPPASYTPSGTLNGTCDSLSKFCGHGEMCDLGINQSKCICSPDFALSTKGDACLTLSRLNQPCISNSQCGFNAECKADLSGTSICQCKDRYGYDAWRASCVLHHSHETVSNPAVQPTVPQPQAGGSKIDSTPVQHNSVQPTVPQPQADGSKTNSTPVQHNLAIIIGGSVGGVVVLGLVILGIVVYIRRKPRPVSINDSECSAPLMGNDDSDNLIM